MTCCKISDIEIEIEVSSSQLQVCVQMLECDSPFQQSMSSKTHTHYILLTYTCIHTYILTNIHVCVHKIPPFFQLSCFVFYLVLDRYSTNFFCFFYVLMKNQLMYFGTKKVYNNTNTKADVTMIILCVDIIKQTYVTMTILCVDIISLHRYCVIVIL